LEEPIQRLARERRALVHCDQHLTIPDGIELAVRSHAPQDEEDLLGGVLGVSRRPDHEIPALADREAIRELPALVVADRCAGRDDRAGVPADLAELAARHARVDQIAERRTVTDGRELIRIADQEEMAVATKRAEELPEEP